MIFWRWRFHFLFPALGLPPRRPFHLKIPDTMRGLRLPLQRTTTWGVQQTRRSQPQKASFTLMYTKVTQGRNPKYTDGWTSERSSSLEYRRSATAGISSELKELLLNGLGSQISPLNWDVAQPPSFDDSARPLGA